MFSGIVEEFGIVTAIEKEKDKKLFNESDESI